ncbi:mechanosensitive ion channel domain-containing protein [Oceanisphaera sp. IT1-181]|uniref:mechanosensitive ion channel domain-containing protein n=1 Tax=Oceanisphaera sp. IT1-181 TaxID=3081199 RepID=UPI0029C9B853|nr:mechanosensitive ion channel domain-containing protein [Oceanisphaera sp. IT1-181]
MNQLKSLTLLLLWMLCAPLMSVAHAQSATTPSPAPYEALAEILENEQTRTQLIEQLHLLSEQQKLPASQTQAAQGSPAASPSEQTGEPSKTKQLADTTRNIAGDMGKQFHSLANVIQSLLMGDIDGDNGNFKMSKFVSASINLGLVIIATWVIFWLLRRLARPIFTRLSHWSRHSESIHEHNAVTHNDKATNEANSPNKTPVLRLVVGVAVAAVVDVLALGLAYAAGSLIATFVIGQTGELTTQASLFLNAFLVIELLKAGLRVLFSSGYDGLRLLPINGQEARYWNRWFALLIGLVGYGVMVLEPLVNINVSPTLSQAINTLIMLVAFIYAVIVILKNRLRLRRAIRLQAEKSTLSAGQFSLILLSRTWHLIALAYFATVFVLTLLSPAEALPFVLYATLKTLAVIVVAILLSTLLSQTIGRHINLSDDLRRKLPLLEPRINSYVPTALRFLRILIVSMAVLLVLNAWYIVDLNAWYESEAGGKLMSKVIAVAIILAVAALLWVLLASLIEHKLNPETGSGQPSARAQTLLLLFRNALAITLATMTFMIALSQIGINIGPLIAGAGVLGLAIGFGAQKLVQDIITGVFIQIENAMNTGDVVTLAGITGTAERLSIRSVGIRDINGTYHIIPFSSVDTVSNYMREFGYHVGVYRVAYRESIDAAIEQLQLAFDELAANKDMKHEVLDALEVSGVVALADSSVNIRVRIKTTPGMQWAVGRAYNRLVKQYFEQAGIEIPFPHSTVYFGVDKAGSAPAANVQLMEQAVELAATEERQAKPLSVKLKAKSSAASNPSDDAPMTTTTS